VDLLNGAATSVGQFAGHGHNSGCNWNCMKDNENLIFNDGTNQCNRNYHCLPVSVWLCVKRDNRANNTFMELLR
jgi:hypothetical protein